MIFREELARAIVQGRKTATRRKLSDNPNSPWARDSGSYPVGKTFTVNPGRGKHRVAECKIIRRYMQRLGAMTEADALAEGFDSLADFIATWTRINGSYDVDEVVHVIEFELTWVWSGVPGAPGAPQELAA